MFKIAFIIIGIIAATLGIILYFNINKIFASTLTNNEIQKMKIMILILSFNLMLTFAFSIYNAIITAHERFIFQKIMALVNYILKPALTIPLLFLGYKSITICIIITITNIIVLVSNFLYCKKNLKISIKYMGFDKKIFKIISKYSIWIFLGIIVDKINWSVDTFVLGAVSGTIAVSVYSLASTLNQLFISLSTAISSIMLPKISKLIANKSSDEEITKEFIKIGRLQYFIIFLMITELILVGREFFNIWAGPSYSDAYYISLLLTIPVCIPLIQNLGISIMQAKNMHKFRSLLLVFISIINILISIPLSKLYGGIGAAIGTAASLLIGNGIIINIYYHKKVRINIIKFWKEIIKMTIPFLIPLILILLFIHFIKLEGIISLIIYGILYAIIYFITAYFFAMNTYEKNIVNNIFKKICIKKVQ